MIGERIGWPHSDPDAASQGCRAAPGVPAAGSGLAHGVCGRGAGAGRFLVPAVEIPVGFGQVRSGEAAAGADDGLGLFAVGGGAAGPVAQRGGPVRRLVAADRALGAVPRLLVWDGEGAVGRRRGGRIELTAGVPGVPRHAGHEACISASPVTRRRKAWSRGSMTTWNGRGCRAGSSPPRPTSTPSWPGGSPREYPVAAAPGVRPVGPDRRGPGGDDPAAAGSAGHRVAPHRPAAPRPLRAAGRQRLLSRSGGDRPPRRGHRGPVPGPRDLRRADRRRSRADLGQAPDHHRPGAPGRREGAAGCPRGWRRSPAPRDAEVEQRDLAVYDALCGSREAV